MSAADNTKECTDFVEINQNNYQIIKNKAIKVGYSDGVNDGRQSVFQKGFDLGYKDGFTTALKLEKYRFFFENLNTDKLNNTNLAKEKDEFSTLQLKDLKSLKIEGNNLNLESQDYVDKLLNKYKQNMPVATKLLNV